MENKTSLEKLYLASRLIKDAKFELRDNVECDIHRELYAKIQLEKALKIMNDVEAEI